MKAERFKARTDKIQKPHPATGRIPEGKDDQSDPAGRELETLRSDLEKELIRHTRKLQVLKEKARQASQANADISTAINHEICNPVNGILAITQLMTDLYPDTRQSVIAQAIAKSGLSLLETTSQIHGIRCAETQCVENPAQLTDVEYINEMKRNFKTGLFRSLVQQYCKDAEQTLHDLEYAVKNRDFPTAQNLLHLLKGCSANFGATAIVELCTDFTRQLKSGQGMTETDIAQLKQKYDGTRDRLLQAAG